MARIAVLFALASVFSAPPAAAETTIYRLELAGGQTILARTPPVPKATRLVFSRHPDGAVMSLKRADVRRVVSVAAPAAPKVGVTEVRPGTLVILGPTGEGSAGTQPAGATAPARPGAAPDGRALLNPQRDYRADWDSSQVPGQNMPYPASAGDYREGRTMSFPPGTATQSGTGQPPTGVPSGPPPK